MPAEPRLTRTGTGNSSLTDALGGVDRLHTATDGVSKDGTDVPLLELSFPKIFGLPAHPLLVHAAVVLVPLAALALVAVGWKEAWRRVYYLPVALIAMAGAGSAFLAKQSGETLASAYPGRAAICTTTRSRATWRSRRLDFSPW